jgi:hypothetical protein
MKKIILFLCFMVFSVTYLYSKTLMWTGEGVKGNYLYKKIILTENGNSYKMT